MMAGVNDNSNASTTSVMRQVKPWQIQHKILLFATDHQTLTRLNHKTGQRVYACVLNGQCQVMRV